MPRQQTPPRYDQEANGYFYAYWYEADGNGRGRTKRESLGVKTEEEARVRFAHWLLSEKEEDAPAGTSCADVIRYYIKEHVSKRKTKQEGRIRRLEAILSRVGHYSASAVKASVIAKYVADRRVDGLKDGTIKNEVYALAAAFSFAARRDFGGVDRPLVFESPSSSPVKEDWLTREEIDVITNYARIFRPPDGRISAPEIFLQLGLRTAARRTAILQLEWSKVDLKRGVIDYRSNWWMALRDNERSKGRPIMPISNKLRPWLEQAYLERGNSKFVVPRHCEVQWSIDGALKKIEKDTGIKCNPHKLRRTYATLAAMAGVSMDNIARVLANTVAMVEKRYARFSPEYLKHAVEIDDADI